MATKIKRGRPKLDNPANVNVTIWVKPEIADQMDKIRQHEPRSSWVRRLIEAAIGK